MNPWAKTKRNHGLEHATIALLLLPSVSGRPVAGYSIPAGFLVLGDIPTQQVEEAAKEALRRMQAGEGNLAVSPFCGTNIVVGAALATMASLGGYRMAGGGSRGLSRAFSNTMFAIVASRPLDRLVQERCTTSADVGSMSIRSVTRHRLGPATMHWVATRFEATEAASAL